MVQTIAAQEPGARGFGASRPAVLEAVDLTKSFGGVQAVDGLSFAVPEGEIVALIGPNGAGKTSAFNLMTGVITPDAGKLWFRGQSIDGLAPHQIAVLGIARTFQNVQIFGTMTVLENVAVGRHKRSQAGLLASALRLPSARREERAIFERAHHFLQWVGLTHRAEEVASFLPFGQQRLLEIARALATEPALLLLDEPAAGLNPAETENLADLVCRIRDSGITVLLVEHDMDLVMSIADRVIVLDNGRKIADGSPDEVQNDERVIAAYLGGELNGNGT